MNRILSLTAAVLISIAAVAQSQVKVSAKYAKGDFAVYDVEQQIETTSQTAGLSQKTNFTGQVKFDVIGVQNDGYTLAINVQKWDNTDGDSNDLTSTIASINYKMLTGIQLIVRTDNDGKLLHLENYEEVKEKSNVFIDKLFNEIAKGDNEQEPMVINTIKERLGKQLTEEATLEIIRQAANHLSLYGKTLANGTMEDEELNEMKFKTTYIVTTPQDKGAYNIKSSAVGNMNEDEIANLIIKQVEKMMPEQADMIKQNIDMLKGSGLLKIDLSKQCSFGFNQKGWLLNSESELKVSQMATETITTSKWKLKDSNWK